LTVEPGNRSWPALTGMSTLRFPGSKQMNDKPHLLFLPQAIDIAL